MNYGRVSISQQPSSISRVIKKTEIKNNFINPFETKVPFLIPLKTPENQRFYDVFRVIKKATLV